MLSNDVHLYIRTAFYMLNSHTFCSSIFRLKKLHVVVNLLKWMLFFFFQNFHLSFNTPNSLFKSRLMALYLVNLSLYGVRGFFPSELRMKTVVRLQSVQDTRKPLPPLQISLQRLVRGHNVYVFSVSWSVTSVASVLRTIAACKILWFSHNHCFLPSTLGFLFWLMQKVLFFFLMGVGLGQKF